MKIPTKTPTVRSPLSGQKINATPAAAAINPAPMFDERPVPSSGGVIASEAPCRMKSTPMNVARLSTDQSMPRMSMPKTSDVMPAKRKMPQWRATSSASARPKLARVLIGFISTVPPPRSCATSLFRSSLQESLDLGQPPVDLLEAGGQRRSVIQVSLVNEDRGDDAGEQRQGGEPDDHQDRRHGA